MVGEMNKILQWNINGYRSRKQELSLILHEEDPSCICLQELKIQNNNQLINLSNLYKTYTKLPDIENNTPKGGAQISCLITQR